MFRLYQIILIFTLITIDSRDNYGQSISIIPTPQSISHNEGHIELPVHLHLDLHSSLRSNPAIEEQLASIRTNISADDGSHNKVTLWISLLTPNSKSTNYCHRHQLTTDLLSKESYHLKISSDTLFIAATAEAGLLYGLYTLGQIIQSSKADQQIPALTIYDYPQFAHRAMMDDISRGPLSNMKFLKQQIKRCAQLKMNRVSYYIEHVVRTQKHPSFAPDDGITPNEFKELSEYAKPYNVELIGSFQSLGHFRNILSHPTYRPLGATDRMLDPADSSSIQFLQDIYAEMLPAFSSEYFNINADEAWDLVHGERSTEPYYTPGQRYIQHVNPLIKYISEHGKKPMLWGDMLLAFPETLRKLPPQSTVLTWEYAGLDQFDAWIDPLVESAIDFWVCPGIVNSYRIFPDYPDAFINIENFVNEGFEKGAKGVMTTIWDDGGRHFFGRDWYGVGYAAEQSWHPQRGRLDVFKRKYNQLFYGDPHWTFSKMIETLDQLKQLKSFQELNTAFLEEALLSDPGQKHQLNIQDVPQIRSLLTYATGQTSVLDSLCEINHVLGCTDLASWKHVINHITLHLDTYKTLLHLSELYQQAYEELDSSRRVAILQQGIKETSLLRERWKALAQELSNLWYEENRDYFLAQTLTTFETNIEKIESVIRSLSSLQNSNSKLPKAAKVQLDITPTNHDYFTFWLVSDTFSIANYNTGKQDFLTSLGGELQAQPTPYDWQKYQSPYSYKIDFSKLYTLTSDQVIYTYARITSDQSQIIHPRINFDGPFEIILNGKRMAKKKNDPVELTLESGKNHLVFKLWIGPTTTDFSFACPELFHTNRKHKYEIQSPK